MNKTLSIEVLGQNEPGVCECCGGTSRVVWGMLSEADEDIACYFVHWTVGAARAHGANFDFLIGSWGDGANASDRRLASVELFVEDGARWLSIADASGRPADGGNLVGCTLQREDVLGTALEPFLLMATEVLLAQDDRLEELAEIPRGITG